MDRHLRAIHLDERPFICSYCKHGFNKKSNLVKHVRMVHERVRPFQCDQVLKATLFWLYLKGRKILNFAKRNLQTTMFLYKVQCRTVRCSCRREDIGTPVILFTLDFEDDLIIFYCYLVNSVSGTLVSEEISFPTSTPFTRRSSRSHVTNAILSVPEQLSSGFISGNDVVLHSCREERKTWML